MRLFRRIPIETLVASGGGEQGGVGRDSHTPHAYRISCLRAIARKVLGNAATSPKMMRRLVASLRNRRERGSNALQ
jgi:hypothetical protein